MQPRPTPPFNSSTAGARRAVVGSAVPGAVSAAGGMAGMTNGTSVYALKELVARLQREQNKIQDLLGSLGFALRSLNNLNQFLELIPMIASRVTDATGGALVMCQPDGHLRLEQLHCSGDDDCNSVRLALEMATRQIAPSPALALKAVDSSSSALTSAAMLSLDRYACRYLGADFQIFGTAIIVQNIERGRLYVFSQEGDYTWSDTRENLVRLVADQTAVAIENNQLTHELRNKERLDRELELGAEIQAQLLPRQCPQIEGVDLAARCQTANKVGGDYYDFIPTTYEQLRAPDAPSSREKPWNFAIGDVMGKGVPAGLMMTMLRGMLRAEVLNSHSPAHLLQHLNWVMRTDLESSNRFVTLFCAQYDPLTQVLSYGNAAHNPPLLWQAATGQVLRLDADGMLLGLDMETHYQENQIQLQPGDTVIYYTDGFTEAADRDGRRFDEDNLIDSFGWACRNFTDSDEILQYLFDMLSRFVGHDREAEDDTTLVVMRITQPAEFRQLSTEPLV
ncbi:PP2C family protein-serine/threonine phosphatase [cf. Phormidesmis sp. LEGE 11477]|uniref:PP2C family protein-serine/threonine phosphatase n=1 Tax=cf. Phormidesmis sp. LEGE 11477 TaxID=1828680 RepID=UPI00187F5CD6|nr:GAF domain-containing SpoIIE family protein phosphatase [cf. Phormidesmis sp. LEGE 11477]MBE9062762.1 SpoIIE family protein phosphatase [cf. Phormidesmis sp. LEGE 11477]